ncbi:hypothetical protein BOW53_04165 [Solemya pervernicosa gill symbiont]|uniref:FAD:protein FMN transferase n=3 Tax=Gammaproteobacteria incertae sedis TaxID=118884 RepID=A0A1T2L8C7_9GAMM|nr:hypothetical protein BOW53_04165 [Solemya pervernicosa gill symbiont]QKQ28325.1 FAD:protein FMN transferase [Candidatus Reidiella endopervernicosa]
MIQYRFKRQSLLFTLVAALLLSACSRDALHHQQIYIFGTLVDVSVWGPDKKQAGEAIDAVAADFQQMHYEWHAWKPGPLVDLNVAFSEGRSIEVLESLLPVIEESRQLYLQSDGLFNPAIGGLIDLWGFHSDELPVGPPPTAEEIAALIAQRPAMDQIFIDGRLVRSGNPAVQLDFGGFAKGYAVDLAIQRLRSMGVEHAIVNAGGDLRAIGQRGGRNWRIGIKHPQGEGVIAALEVEGDESIFTSGNYERYHEYKGQRYPHIIDPRDGMPVRHIASATVIHNRGSVADAAATALVVAGVEGWHRVARNMGIRYALLVDESGTLYLNPAMKKRLMIDGEMPEKVVVSGPLFEGDVE